MSEQERDDLVDALNVLIWKIPVGSYRNPDDFGQYIAAELADKGISVRWDMTEKEFTRERV